MGKEETDLGMVTQRTENTKETATAIATRNGTKVDPVFIEINLITETHLLRHTEIEMITEVGIGKAITALIRTVILPTLAIVHTNNLISNFNSNTGHKLLMTQKNW